MKLDLYSGSRLKMAQAMWPAYYEARLRLGGSTCTICPIGDPLHGKPDALTFTSVGDEQVVWTPATGALDSWGTPLDLRQDSSWQGIIPQLQFDGSTEWIETPDASFWTDTAGASEPSYTWIVWIKLTDNGATQAPWSKSPINDAPGTDWVIYLANPGHITVLTLDDSAAAYIGRQDSTALDSAWHHVGITKSTGTTHTAFVVYLDGVATDDSNISAGTYVQQEDGTTVVRIGAESDGGAPFASLMAGGPLGPLFTPGSVMSADAVLRDYELGRRAMAL